MGGGSWIGGNIVQYNKKRNINTGTGTDTDTDTIGRWTVPGF